MHYSSHPPRAFHHRITKYLGVLVASALIATLGLPSAAQAQSPAAPKVTGTGDGTVDSDAATIEATWLLAPTLPDQTSWKVEYTEPGVLWKDAKALDPPIEKEILKAAIPANDSRIHHGVWKVRVSYWNNDAMKDDVPIEGGARIGMASATTDYHHGPATAAPTGLAAYNAGPDARRLVWDVIKTLTYQSRYTADPTDDDEWTGWKTATSGGTVDKLKAGTEYTFEVRGKGKTRAGVGDLHGPAASTAAMMATPAPTLPEIALLLLAMLLLGSGAYLLRGRQSGGLTHA